MLPQQLNHCRAVATSSWRRSPQHALQLGPQLGQLGQQPPLLDVGPMRGAIRASSAVALARAECQR
eukprot:COSAG01_NODE_7146_length_3331_cov_7.400062_7_plen_66_part_00